MSSISVKIGKRILELFLKPGLDLIIILLVDLEKPHLLDKFRKNE